MPPRPTRPGRPSQRPNHSASLRLASPHSHPALPGIERTNHPSPHWTSTTKLLAGVTILAIIAALFASIKIVLGPLIFALIIAYLTYPLASFLHRRLNWNWRILVSILYLIIYLIMLGFLTWGGIALVEQVQSLIRFVESALKDVPGLIQTWITTPPTIGPFIIDLQRLDVVTLANQALGIIQPLIGQAGNLVGTVASSAATILGWVFFSFLLAYFIVSETHGKPENILRINLPGYTYDIKRIVHELRIIWNAFLRGQLTVFLITSTLYLLTMSILGLRFFYGLALLAGTARFIPYIGPWISWGVTALVAYSQGSTLFGMSPGTYVLVVWLISVLTDALIDNIISPRIFSNALKIHPAAVMVAAIVGFNVIGVAGVILAAPVLATVKLFADYLIAKMFDQEPWENLARSSPPKPMRMVLRKRLIQSLDWIKENRQRFLGWLHQRTNSVAKRH